MDWSEILTESEGRHMQAVLKRLHGLPWAVPLVDKISKAGGITFENKPLLFEARFANALALAGLASAQYEYGAGVGDSTVDFRLGTQPEWLVELVSIGRSAAVEAATFHSGPFFGTLLSSPSSLQDAEERQKSEEGEALLAIQKIGEKVHNGKSPVKFPPPQPGQYHAVVVDMRGHLGGGDIMDWRQIAFGAEAVAPDFRKHWLDKDDRAIPLRGVWHPENKMRFAATARERLHAIMFAAEERYADGAFCEGAWIACNPHLFADEEAARAALASFPLRPVPAPAS